MAFKKFKKIWKAVPQFYIKMKTDKTKIKKLIIANEIMYHNWTHKKCLGDGLELHKVEFPEDHKRMIDCYKRMSEALHEDIKV